MGKYKLRVGDRDEDGHHHCYITVEGWQGHFNEAGDEYFCLSGIAKPSRAQQIVDSANALTITAALIRNIIGALKSIDLGDVSKDILPIEVWRKFSDAPMRFGSLNDAQQDAVAALINARLSASRSDREVA